jgi:serine protease Do
MTTYRIKKSPHLADSILPEEEYQLADETINDDPDPQEAAELNQLADEAEPERVGKPWYKSWPLRVVIAVVIVVFTVWLSFPMLGNTLDWNVLKRSAQLTQDESLAALQDAVVVIESSGSSGTGFNIQPDGLIVTNRHVVEDGGIITIRFGGEDGETFTTRDWVEIEGVDMALIDIAGSDLPYVELQNSYPEAGDDVIFIGNPLGFDWTISEGTVIGIVQLGEVPLIDFNGPVELGSSGSPLFNADSQVIGVIFASVADRDNEGLAIPVSYLITYLEDIYEH